MALSGTKKHQFRRKCLQQQQTASTRYNRFVSLQDHFELLLRYRGSSFVLVLKVSGLCCWRFVQWAAAEERSLRGDDVMDQASVDFMSVKFLGRHSGGGARTTARSKRPHPPALWLEDTVDMLIRGELPQSLSGYLQPKKIGSSDHL